MSRWRPARTKAKLALPLRSKPEASDRPRAASRREQMRVPRPLQLPIASLSNAFERAVPANSIHPTLPMYPAERSNEH